LSSKKEVEMNLQPCSCKGFLGYFSPNECKARGAMLALRKAMQQFPIKNAVSFHSTIAKAIRSQKIQNEIGENPALETGKDSNDDEYNENNDENTLIENRDVIIAKVIPIKENRNDPTKTIKFELSDF
jgi:hypothetical protein